MPAGIQGPRDVRDVPGRELRHLQANCAPKLQERIFVRPGKHCEAVPGNSVNTAHIINRTIDKQIDRQIDRNIASLGK